MLEKDPKNITSRSTARFKPGVSPSRVGIKLKSMDFFENQFLIFIMRVDGIPYIF